MLKDLGQDKNQQEMGSKINKNSNKMSGTSHSKIIQVPNSAMYSSKEWKKNMHTISILYLNGQTSFVETIGQRSSNLSNLLE